MNQLIEQFHFLRPWWLLLLPFGILMWLWLRRPGRELESWEAVCDPQLMAYLSQGQGASRSLWRVLLMAIAWLLAVIALAGPVWDKQPQPLFKTVNARVLILDLSRSMLATDLGTTRLEKARFKIADILDRDQEQETGLISYAGQPFVVTPLTDDAGTIKSMLGALSPDIMPVQGSNLSDALQMALGMLENVVAQNGEIIVIADSVNPRGINKAESVRQQGVRVSVLAVGTEQGSPIPDGRGGYLKARDGSIVIPGVDQSALEKLAKAGGGRFSRLQPDQSDIDYLLGNTEQIDQDSHTEDVDLETEHWIERGPWLLLLLLPLAALAFRRGFVMILPLVLLPAMMPSAHARTTLYDLLKTDELWESYDQQATKALNDGDFEKAAELARDPLLKANALFRAERFQEAAQTYAEVNEADAHYNRGNALAQMQDYQGAIQAYDRALEQQPEMEDAEYNKKRVEELLEQQQEQEQEQQEQDQQNQENQQQDQQQQNSEEESEQEQDQEQQQQSEQEAEEQEAEKQEMQESEDELSAEERQAMEQWLRRIPDDPGGLLRRKFLLQYQRRGAQPPSGEEEW